MKNLEPECPKCEDGLMVDKQPAKTHTEYYCNRCGYLWRVPREVKEVR